MNRHVEFTVSRPTRDSIGIFLKKIQKIFEDLLLYDRNSKLDKM